MPNHTPVDPRVEAGMTMVELIIYSALGMLAVSVVAALFISGIRADATTRDRNTATGLAQVITESIQTSIRNADPDEFGVTGNLLRARVAVGSTDWECRAWALVGTDLWYRSSTAIIPADGNYTTGSWRNIADLAPAGAAVELRGTGPGGRPFVVNDDRLEIRLDVDVAGTVVPVTAGAIAQAKGVSSLPCI